MMWRKIAPALAEQFTVVAADLRGYCDSSKPRGQPDHSNYSFRAMAQDQIDVMSALGHERFMVAGHEAARASSIAWPWITLQRSERRPSSTSCPRSPSTTRPMHSSPPRTGIWFFLIQSYDFPETLITAAPEAFLRYQLGPLVSSGAVIQDARYEYLRCVSDASAVHAVCEDYRAGASIDLQRDRGDLNSKIACPLLVLVVLGVADG
jgi:haloacetate dehalogenase